MAVRVLPPTEENLAAAAALLRAGGLVAFPTETVYGLGANALDAAAVAKIFAAKGRPATNPVIVHIASDPERFAAHWSAQAEALAQAHWPGPLTLVVEKTHDIPDIVTAGGPTVGLRIPNHPVALALLRKAGVPVAAPSANRSESISPTTAQHVADSLGPYLDDLLILDGGPCAVGIESTVLDVTVDPPRVLRPGMIHIHIGPLASPLAPNNGGIREEGIARSPGQLLRHYAPRKPVVLMHEGMGNLALGNTPQEAAERLYAELHRLDADPSVERIVVVLPPETPEWTPIHDRLRRAATQPTPPLVPRVSPPLQQGRG